ncbi:MAG: hypothetical protein GX596_14220 [Propionibacterium sp.]|nr:hypothetical protein [Propionibacterium sp.]
MDEHPARRRIDWAEAAIFAASAGLTLIEPRNLRGWRKTAYWAAISLLTGAAAVAGQRKEREYGWYAYVPQSGSAAPLFLPNDPAIFAGVSGVVFGLREPLLKADAWTADKLEALGVRRPRVALAAVTAVASGLVLWMESRAPVAPGPETEEPLLTDVDPRVRQVVAEMLARSDDWGAGELRAQFGEAQQVDAASGAIRFVVPDGIERLPVRDFLFPVHGHGEIDGVPVTLGLAIEDGRVGELLVRDDDGDFLADIPAEVTYTVGESAGD